MKPDELDGEKWVAMLGIPMEEYRRRVMTDPMLSALDKLSRELWVSRQRALQRCRELMVDESPTCYWALKEIWQQLGGDAPTAEQMIELNRTLYPQRVPFA